VCNVSFKEQLSEDPTTGGRNMQQTTLFIINKFDISVHTLDGRIAQKFLLHLGLNVVLFLSLQLICLVE